MKIQDLLNQSKPCWKYAAMDKGKNWTLFERKPNLIGGEMAHKVLEEIAE